MAGVCQSWLPPSPHAGRSWLREHLRTANPATWGIPTAAGPTGIALQAGLLLWHDELDESHKLSQSIEGAGDDRLGDVWHAIMHRREPDYSNAKYWFRQIGRHPLYRRLLEPAQAIFQESNSPAAADWEKRLVLNESFDPFAFVDLCQNCSDDEESELALVARRIQLAEMSLLIRMNLEALT